MHLSLPKQFPLFILASSVCKSLQCLISALTQGGKGCHLFRLICSVVLWGGKDTVIKYRWHGSVCTVWTTLDLPKLMAACAFWVYTAQAASCSAGALSKTGPAFCALPRSKLLKFRFSGTPQGHKLGWACVLCPFHVQAAQTHWCLTSAPSQVDHAS